MAYNTSTLVSEVKALAKDASLTDSMVMGWLQDVQDIVLGRHRLPFLEVIGLQTLVTADKTFGYWDDLQTVLSVTLTDGTSPSRPDFIPYAQFDDCYPQMSLIAPGRPHEFTDFGRQLYWSCPLDKGYQLTMRYLRKPVRLSSGAIIPDIPEEFKQILVRGALASAEEYRENFDIAALHQRRSEEVAEDFLLRYGVRQLTAPTRYSTAYRRGQTAKTPRLG